MSSNEDIEIAEGVDEGHEQPTEQEQEDVQEEGQEGGAQEGAQEDEEAEAPKKHSKKKRKKHSKFVESEAVESGSDANDSSEEDGGDSQDEYETMDGFTVAPGEEEEEPRDGQKKRKKRSKKKKHKVLDIDDIELLRENTGQNHEMRNKPDKNSSKKFQRLKQGGGRKDLQSNIARRIFGDESDAEEATAENVEANEPRSEDEVLDSSDEDDMRNFIVGKDNKPIKQRKQNYLREEERGFLHDAEKIFGSGAADYFRKASRQTDEQALVARRRRRTSYEDGDYGEEPREYSDAEQELPAEEPEKVQSIYDHYEPSELEQKFFTAADEQIRQLDVPERHQLRKGTPYDETAVQDEAEWIFARAFARVHAAEKVIIVQRIVHVLRFLQEQQLEIPFISTYRKDYFQPLKIYELWDIHDWDEKWGHLQARKNNLMEMCKKIEELANYSVDDTRDYVEMAKESQTEEDLNDLTDFFQVFYGEQLRENLVNADGTTKLKRALKRDLYTTAKRNNLGEFAKKFGVTPKEFGDNLMDNYSTHTPIDHEEDPEILAEAYKCRVFPNTESVIKATRVMCAQEISHDFHVRQSVRSVYMKRAIVSTVPTLKGKKEIDAFHPYMLIKQMNMPATAFTEAQMLLVLKAEKEGFITTAIHTEEKELLQEMEPLYTSDGTSATAEAWNNHRREILGFCLRNHLFPLFARELRARLTQDAQEYVASQYSRRLEAQILVAPWAPEDTPKDDKKKKNDDDEDELPPPLRIMATSRGGLGESTMACVLDEEGEVVDILKLNFLNERRSNATERSSSSDLVSLEGFIKDYQPRAIVIGAESLECRRYFEDISGIVTRLRGSRELRETCKVLYSDTELARAFKQSHRGIAEFSEYPPLLRQTVSLGRKLLDPVTEFANSCDDINGNLVLRLHDLQDMVPPDVLRKSVTRVFMNVVNAVGVDVNRMLTHKWAATSMQYVSGLGVRKAEYLLREIFRKGRTLAFREDLSGFVGSCVYNNCAGFIRIREKHFYYENITLEPLDDTRIHPEDYKLARKMAADALDQEGQDEREIFQCIINIMKKPKQLDEIDLDAFATMLESSGEVKRLILYDIKKELTHAFADIRTKYTDPTNTDIFDWLTGETDHTLAVGMIVAARAYRSTERSVLCRLESGLIGFINSENVSDDRDAAVSSTIPAGMTVNSRVLSIDKEKFSLRLSCRGSDLESPKWEWDKMEEMQKINKYLIIELDQKSEEPKKDVVKRTTWNVHHPLFHDVDFVGAEKFLSDKPIGEVVIRPSSKAHDHLTFSWKFYENVFVHTDVQVRDKASARSLGSLFIGENKYDDLDEIVARYTDPITFFVNEMVTYRKFKKSHQSDVDQLVTYEKGASPQTIPYYVTAPKEHPGRFEITYMPSTKLKHEFISVKPEGFVFRRQPFKGVEQLIKWFKVHFRDPIAPRSMEKPTKVVEPVDVPVLQPVQHITSQMRMPTPQIHANATPAHPSQHTPAHGGWANAAAVEQAPAFGMQPLQQTLPPATPVSSLWSTGGGWEAGGWENNNNHSNNGATSNNNNNNNNYDSNFNANSSNVGMGWENESNTLNNNYNENSYADTNNNDYNNRDDRGRRDTNYNSRDNNNFGGRDSYNRNNNNFNNKDNRGEGGGGGGGGGYGRDNNHNSNNRDNYTSNRDNYNNRDNNYNSNNRDNNYNSNKDNYNSRDSSYNSGRSNSYSGGGGGIMIGEGATLITEEEEITIGEMTEGEVVVDSMTEEGILTATTTIILRITDEMEGKEDGRIGITDQQQGEGGRVTVITIKVLVAGIERRNMPKKRRFSGNPKQNKKFGFL